MGKDKIMLGRLGEATALEYLRKSGYGILRNNYRCKMGEIDIVASQGSTVIFVEVKTRSTDAFGCAQECITASKQRTIRNVAMHYLLTSGQVNCPVRFDVLAVKPSGASHASVTEHIINAF